MRDLKEFLNENSGEVKKYEAYFTTPFAPDSEDAEGWIIYGTDEEDAFKKFVKQRKEHIKFGKKNLMKFYGWEIKELDKKSENYKKKDFTQIM